MGVDNVQVLGMLVGRLLFDLKELIFGFVDRVQKGAISSSTSVGRIRRSMPPTRHG